MCYSRAKGTITNMELRRFTASYFNIKNPNQAVDWDAAAKDFDSSASAANTASFKTFISRAIKKYKNYSGAKDKIADMELRRCTAAFLNVKGWNQAVDWDAAARDFGGAGKPASFRTFVQRARAKYAALAEESDAENGTVATPVKAKAKKGGKKRKATEAVEEEEDDDVEAKPKVDKARKKGKKGKAELLLEETVDDRTEETHAAAEKANAGVEMGEAGEAAEQTGADVEVGDARDEAMEMPQESEVEEMQEGADDGMQAEEQDVAEEEHNASRNDSLAGDAAVVKDEDADEGFAEEAVAGGNEEEHEEDAVEEPFVDAQETVLDPD